MPHKLARNTIIRLACFAALWLVALVVRNAQRGDPHWMTKVAWMAAFSVPTVLILWIIQRLARYRIPWPIELIAMPFAIGALVTAAVAVRQVIRHST
jgi:hypothetical protein